MTVFVIREGSTVMVQARATGKGLIGDATWTVRPGETLHGHPYEWWSALENGKYEVEPKIEK